MKVKFYASSNTIRRCDTSNYGISQTFTLEQLGLQGCEDSNDFETPLQDALLALVVETCDIKFTIIDE